ncbi:MAG: hypothetical protein J6A37_04445 [Oscillospiraceae bacterium]|nr:hypothetical protein [Oscillospiraceae bacterium]
MQSVGRLSLRPTVLIVISTALVCSSVTLQAEPAPTVPIVISTAFICGSVTLQAEPAPNRSDCYLDRFHLRLGNVGTG